VAKKTIAKETSPNKTSDQKAPESKIQSDNVSRRPWDGSLVIKRDLFGNKWAST
jgi:hypothetical protein